MKKVLFSILGLCLISVGGFAATSDTLSLSATVAAINSVSFTTGASLTDPATAANTNVAVGTITCDNNNPGGFSITLTSTNSGKFIRSTTTGSNAGDFLGYTITVAAGGAGTLGSTEPTLPSSVALTSPKVINYNTSILGATYDKTYTIKLTASQKRDLFRGSFADTITVDIADL